MKLPKAFLLAIALSLASYGGVRPQSRQSEAARPAIVQNQERTKDLGEGYQSKIRNYPGEGDVVLIHFPADRYYGKEEDFPRFREAVFIALVKEFGCSAFKNCLPELKPGVGKGVFVEAGGLTYDLSALVEGDGANEAVIGIALIPVTRG